MIVGVVKESFPGEARVAMVPGLVPQLAKAGIEVMIESGAGTAAGFLDQEYTAKGAKVVGGRREVARLAARHGRHPGRARRATHSRTLGRYLLRSPGPPLWPASQGANRARLRR